MTESDHPTCRAGLARLFHPRRAPLALVGFLAGVMLGNGLSVLRELFGAWARGGDAGVMGGLAVGLLVVLAVAFDA